MANLYGGKVMDGRLAVFSPAEKEEIREAMESAKNGHAHVFSHALGEKIRGVIFRISETSHFFETRDITPLFPGLEKCFSSQVHESYWVW